MGLLLFLAIGGVLTMAGDQISPVIWPSLAPRTGYWILLSGFLLLSALTFAPSRFLAQNVIMGILTGALLCCRILLQSFLALFRLMWTTGRVAFQRLWGDLRQ